MTMEQEARPFAATHSQYTAPAWAKVRTGMEVMEFMEFEENDVGDGEFT